MGHVSWPSGMRESPVLELLYFSLVKCVRMSLSFLLVGIVYIHLVTTYGGLRASGFVMVALPPKQRKTVTLNTRRRVINTSENNSLRAFSLGRVAKVFSLVLIDVTVNPYST